MKIYIVVLFIVVSTVNCFSLPSNHSIDDELPSVKYEWQAGIGNEYVPYGDDLSSGGEETGINLRRSSRPNADEDVSVGGEMPVADGIVFLLLLVGGYTLFLFFKKRKQKNNTSQ